MRSEMAEINPRPQTVLYLGAATVSIFPGWTVTRFMDGSEVCARHDDCAELDQARTAQDLGYPDVPSMNRDHDMIHNLLPVWLGIPKSPTLYGVATQQPWPHAWAEESVVLALQRLLRLLGIDPMALATRL
jgi:hypothetical protein